MEYRDYRTNETISREQYIANGLERGELLYKLECGCVIIQDRTADAYIVFCPLHEVAPELYEALLAVYRDIDLQSVDGGSDELNILVQQVIAKVKGK